MSTTFAKKQRSTLSASRYLTSGTALVLQASHSQNVVRRVVVTIVVYYECVDTFDWQRGVEIFRYANTQYNEALSRLRQQAFVMTSEDVFLSCVIFSFFGNARGEVDAALKHLYTANPIL